MGHTDHHAHVERDGHHSRTEKDGDIVITREFDAPLEQVWDAWTKSGNLMKWWGPKNYTSPSAHIDFRVGGKYIFCMRSKDGKDFYSTGTYEQIVPQSRFVFTDSFSDENGNIVSAAEYGFKEEFPLVLRVTVSLEEVDGKTNMTLRHEGMPTGDMANMSKVGWNESFDKLALVLEELQ